MNTPKVTVQVRNVRDDVAIVDIRGEVTGFAEEALSEAYSQACSASPRAVVLNFSGLDYMNSSGIGLLVTLLIRAQRMKQRLMACGLNEHYRQIFELTRLNEAIAIYPSEKEAVAAIA